MKNSRSTHRTRTPLAITLIVASFLSAFLLASFSRSTTKYWIATSDLTVGHQISTADLRLVDMNLDSSSMRYLSKELDPVGQTLVHAVLNGELIGIKAVSSNASLLASSAVPLSIRSVDLADGIQASDLVDIYWVIDSQNGEYPQEPVLVLGTVVVLSVEAKSKNFGTDAAITVSVEQTQVLRLLAATTQGRLVVIRSNV